MVLKSDDIDIVWNQMILISDKKHRKWGCHANLIIWLNPERVFSSNNKILLEKSVLGHLVSNYFGQEHIERGEDLWGDSHCPWLPLW